MAKRPAFRLQGRNRHPAVVGERRIDMDEVDVGIGQHVAEALVSAFNAERIADLVERNTRPAADRVHVCHRMPLVDGNELRPETETDDRDIDPAFLHGSPPLDFERFSRRDGSTTLIAAGSYELFASR